MKLQNFNESNSGKVLPQPVVRCGELPETP